MRASDDIGSQSERKASPPFNWAWKTGETNANRQEGSIVDSKHCVLHDNLSR